VVSIFPDAASVLRLVGSILIEAHDEWQAGRRYFSKDSMRKLKEPDRDPLAQPTPLRLAPIR
jgi:transposase-like protein